MPNFLSHVMRSHFVHLLFHVYGVRAASRLFRGASSFLANKREWNQNIGSNASVAPINPFKRVMQKFNHDENDVSGVSSRTKMKPNIVFLMSDSMDGRMVDEASPESKTVKLPFLQGFLSKNGANFVSTYSNNPMCVPSRSSMMTGRSSDSIHVWENGRGIAASPNGVLDDGCVKTYSSSKCQQWAAAQNVTETIFSAMQKLGYTVHVHGKLHFGASLLNIEDHEYKVRGEQTYSAFDGISFGDLARSADIRSPVLQQHLFLDRVTQDGPPTGIERMDWGTWTRCRQFVEAVPAYNKLRNPFFLHCSFNLPHYTYHTNSTWLEQVNDKKVRVPTWLPDFPARYHPYDSFQTIAMGVDAEQFTETDILNLRRTYYGMCAEVDSLLSDIWNGLQEKGYGLDNTYVMYVSDHGEMKFEHRQMAKASMYEGSARVPLQIAGPGITKGMYVDTHHTSLLDVFPTLLDMAQEQDWDTHLQLQGMSVLEVAGGTSLAPARMKLTAGTDNRDFVLTQYNWLMGNTGAYMVRSGPWKCIFYGHTFQAYKNYKPQLFDLTADPEELHNVAGANPHVVEKLYNRLHEVLDPEHVDRSVFKDIFQISKYMLNWESCSDLITKWVGTRMEGLPVEAMYFDRDLLPEGSTELMLNWCQEASDMFS